jgi:rfaE bifunctional protein kinase chain/domain
LATDPRPSRVPGRDGLRAALPHRRLDELLDRFSSLRVAVLGDFFLDAYFDCDPDLNEPSLETGRTCYQVVRTRRQAGAAGTVAANLIALGAGRVDAIGFCGDDGEGWELRRAMVDLGLDLTGFLTVSERRTPTYGKPCYIRRDGRRMVVTQELERIDIRNRQPTPRPVRAQLLEHARAAVRRWDALVVVDQVSEAACGVVNTSLRSWIESLASQRPQLVILADSRQRIQRFRKVPIKPNHREAAAAIGQGPARSVRAAAAQAQLLVGDGRPVYLTLAERGMIVATPGVGAPVHVAGFPVTDAPVDPVGAGDSTTAALVCCLAAGAAPVEAALVANLVGSVTVQQIGTTGTASPARIRRRWREVVRGLPPR